MDIMNGHWPRRLPGHPDQHTIRGKGRIQRRQGALHRRLASGFQNPVKPLRPVDIAVGDGRQTVNLNPCHGRIIRLRRIKDAIDEDDLQPVDAVEDRGFVARVEHRCSGGRGGIQAGRVWVNCYHAYPAHAAFGGYKKSGIGRETHRRMLAHYQQTKNLLVSYSPDKLGFF